MSAIVQAQANKLLDASLGTASLTAFSGAPKVRLTTTAPTNTAAGTELTGTGYTAGGTATAFNAAASGQATGPTVASGALTWTNGSGSGWSIVGVEVWDQAGTPLRWWFGNFNGQPISVANGNTFRIDTGALTFSLS
jgi:hypothetical protein